MKPRSPAEDLLHFNGINAATGEPSFQPESEEVLLTALAEEPLAETKAARPFSGLHRGRLERTGWGVIFHRDADPSVRAALAPLLAWRRQQAAKKNPRLFRDLAGDCGYWPGEDRFGFLERHDVRPGADEPEAMPYYLLLVGGPEEIPFSFQYQLDAGFAVGRLSFDHLDDYRRYAESVVAAERDGTGRQRALSLFAPRHRDDEATRSGEENLVMPLHERFSSLFARARRKQPWRLDAALGAQAKKERLLASLAAADGPALVLSVSHGLTFSCGHELQAGTQGALVCSEWPGAVNWPRALPADFYVAASDLGDEACPHGLICFHFACFSGGTPEEDNFPRDGSGKPPRLAPRPFVAALPKRLLAHPKGGALAVVGHVDSAWAHSFLWRRLEHGRYPSERTRPQPEAFEQFVKALLEGLPVGAAMEGFTARSEALLREAIYREESGGRGRRAQGHQAWLRRALADLRNYVLLGDPAVRLAV